MCMLWTPRYFNVRVMYGYQFYHTNTGLKTSSVWIHSNCYVDLSWWSLWSYDFYHFNTTTKESSWFTWYHPSYQLVFYDSPVSFPALNVKCMFVRLLIYVSFGCWNSETLPWIFVIECPLVIKVHLWIQLFFNSVEFWPIVYE